jgi:hypothetical protein
MKLPPGPGEPAADGASALNEATNACRAVSTLSAEVGVSGSINSQRVRGRLLVGAAAPASARIEAVAPFGQPLFIFVSRGDDATLLLPRDNRALEHGPSASVLEAVAGVPLDAADLRLALTGCASPRADGGRARQVGADWRIVPDGPSDVYVRREGSTGTWQIVATVHRPPNNASQVGDDWRAEYGDFQNGLPRTVRFRSADGKRFDLRLALSQVDVNAPLDADVFEVEIPRGADPISLDELRRTRLGAREN